jgi:hypothetical protein
LELISASGGAWLGTNLSCVVSIVATNTPPPFLSAPLLNRSGVFSAQVAAAPGLIVSLQVSTNLMEWQTLQTFTNTANAYTVKDPTAIQRPVSYYRLVNP